MKKIFWLFYFAFCITNSNAQNISTVKGTSGLDGICIDEQGNITGLSSGTIYKYAPDGKVKLKYRGNIKNRTSGVSGPARADKKGNIYYFDLVPVNGQLELSLLRIDNNEKVTSIWTESNIVTGKINLKVSCSFVINSGPPFGVNSIAVDNSGNTYFPIGNFIFKIDGGGKLTLFAGGAIYYGDAAFSLKGNNGPANTAYIAKASHLKFDNQGNLYFLDGIGQLNGTACIRKIDASGTISIVTDGRTMDNNPTQKISPVIHAINSFAVDNNGNFIITDKYRNTIYKLSPNGNVSVLAGKEGQRGYSGDGGAPAAAKINLPDDIASDSKGNIFFTDNGNWVVREISNSAANDNNRDASCPIFTKMQESAKELDALADRFEKDDIFYYSCVVDMIARGYNAPNASSCLTVRAEHIPQYFKDNLAIEKARPQLVANIRAKASVRTKLAGIDISHNYEEGIYSKQTMTLFCYPIPEKFTRNFWYALWEAGYIDYDLYSKTDDLITLKGFLENLKTDCDAIELAAGIGEAAIFIQGGTKFVLSKFSIGTLKALFKKKDLPAIVVEAKNTTALVETASGIIKPGGKLIGEAGSKETIRELSGGAEAASSMWRRLLSAGGRSSQPTGSTGKYEGIGWELPDGTWVGYRTYMKKSPGTEVTIDVKIPNTPLIKLKFNP